MSVCIDGVRMRIIPHDADGDGVRGEVEDIHSHGDKGIVQLKDMSELGEVLEHQVKDVVNEERLSSVDFISNLNSMQVAPICAVEFIASSGVISGKSRGITRIIKRNVISIDAMGRKQNVEIAIGKREQDVRRAGVQNLTPTGQK